MKFKYVLIEKKPLDGLPRFKAQVVEYPFYMEAVGQTASEALSRLKSKLEEDLDRGGVVNVTVGELEVP